MNAIMADPTVQAVLIGVLVAFGLYITALFRSLTANLEQAREDIQEVKGTTAATITLVDGQLSEVKGQLKEMTAHLQASMQREAAGKENAAEVALQTVKDQAAQAELQAVKDQAVKEVQAAKNAAPRLTVANGGGTQSVTIPTQTLPVEDAVKDPPRIVKP